jgi:hypothetical protein
MAFKLQVSRFLNGAFSFALVIACVITLRLAYYVSFLTLAILMLIIYIWLQYDSRIILGVAFFLSAVTGFLFLLGDISKVIEVGSYAWPLFGLGIISWVISFSRKKLEIKSINFERLKSFVSYLIVAFFVALVGDYLRIWVRNPVGDDAFTHIGKVLFILNHFPNVNWYPYWYLGFDMFRTYPAIYYVILAGTHLLTGIPIPSLVVIYFFSSMVLLGFGIYGFSRLLHLPRSVSVGLAVMLLSFPVSWAWGVTGGAYIRSFALSFYVLSVLTVYYHTVQINSGKDDLKIFFVATFILAFTILLHEMTFLFASTTAIMIYILAIQGTKQKVKTLLKVFIPVCGLVSWTYIPILEGVIMGGGLANEISYESYDHLFIDYNLVFVPLVIVSAVALFLVWKKYKPNIRREDLSVVLVFFILSTYLFLFGWIQMPSSLYIMAAYDYRQWFGYSLIMFLLGILGLLYNFFRSDLPQLKSPSFKRYKQLFNNFLVASLIVMLPAAFVISLPTLNVMNISPEDPQSFIYSLRYDTDRIVNELPENYRLAFDTRRIFSFQYYAYPNLETTGGREGGELNPYYDSIFDEMVFYRYPGELEKPYFEEQPPIRVKIPNMESNFYSSMFWLDWFGVQGVIIAPWETQTTTFNEYTLRPQFFEMQRFGDTVLAQYKNASPIVMSSNASTLGIVVSDKYEEQSYSEAFITLGEINLNSQWVIPLKLTIADLNKDLSYIDDLVVSPTLYEARKTLLDDYASNGGHLIIMNYRCTGNETKLAELTSPGLRFYTYALPLSECPLNSEALAETAQGPVAYRLNVDKGLITRSAVSIQELYEMATPTASLYLAKILIPGFALTEVQPIPNTWYLQDLGGVVEASINQTPNGEVTLSYELNKTCPYNKVTFATLLKDESSTSSTGVIQFELWNDGEIQSIQISQVNTKSQAFLYYTLSNSSWQGWKLFSIPLASFIKEPDVDLLGSFNGIAFTPLDLPPYSSGNHTLKVRNLGFYKCEQTPSYKPLEGTWAEPNRFEISTNDETFNLLWKETYVSDWRIETQPISDTKFYYAGPGVIYARLPHDVKKVTFAKVSSKSQQVGIVISLLTFPTLIILAIYKMKFARGRKVKREGRTGFFARNQTKELKDS